MSRKSQWVTFLASSALHYLYVVTGLLNITVPISLIWLLDTNADGEIVKTFGFLLLIFFMIYFENG